MRAAAARQRLRLGGLRGAVLRWECGTCGSTTRTRGKTLRHVEVARVTGFHGAEAQRYAERQYKRAARQLRRQGGRAR